MRRRPPRPDAPSPTPTLADVARLAGVSAATVSRTLTQPATVRGETRQRVLDAVSALDYRPNRAARGLSTGRSGTLGMLVPDIANPFFAELIRSAQAAAHDHGWMLLVADTSRSEAYEIDVLESLSGQIDGVIVCSPRFRTERLAPRVARLPMVFVNRRDDGVPSVLIDQGAIVRISVRHLEGLGHRHMVFLAGPDHLWSSQCRLDAVRSLDRTDGVDIEVIGAFEATFEGGARAAEAVVSSGATAVIAFNDVMAVGLMSRLATLGVSVPRDLSVVGSDDVPLSSMWTPTLTTISAPTRAAGESAVEVLCRSIDEGTSAAKDVAASRPAHPLRRIELEGHLVVRASTMELQG